jgi:hypothetical protein
MCPELRVPIQGHAPPKAFSLRDPTSRKHHIYGDALVPLHQGEKVIAEVIEICAVWTVGSSLLGQQPEQKRVIVLVVSASSVQGFGGGGPPVEILVNLHVADAANRDAVAGIEKGQRDCDLAKDVMRAQARSALAQQATVSISLTSEGAPESQTLISARPAGNGGRQTA